MLEEGKSPLMTECVDGKNWRSMGYVKKKKSGCTIKDYDPSYNANWSACGAAAEISALSWFFIVVLCIAVTAGVTWLFMNYKRFIHNGRIR